jgi:hypothetical protein
MDALLGYQNGVSFYRPMRYPSRFHPDPKVTLCSSFSYFYSFFSFPPFTSFWLHLTPFNYLLLLPHSTININSKLLNSSWLNCSLALLILRTSILILQQTRAILFISFKKLTQLSNPYSIGSKIMKLEKKEMPFIYFSTLKTSRV